MPRLIEQFLPLEDGVRTNKPLVVASSQALVAGGNSVPMLATGAVTSPNIYCGSGVPTISAPQGSQYLRSDGSSTSTRMYINTNGTTGWTAVTTAS